MRRRRGRRRGAGAVGLLAAAWALGGVRAGVDFSKTALKATKVSGTCEASERCRRVPPLLSVPKPLAWDAVRGLRRSPSFAVWMGLPESTFWVNLHPTQPDRMIDAGLGATETGRLLLEADLQLKRTAAELLHPHESELGRAFWDDVYDFAGMRDAKLCYSLRQWIVPGPTEVLEAEDAVHVVAAPLEVKHESAFASGAAAGASAGQAVASASSRAEDQMCRGVEPAVREHAEAQYAARVLPRVTHAVNHDPRYQGLRDVFLWRIVAEWAKGGGAEWARGGAAAAARHDAHGGWERAAVFREYLDSVQHGEFRLQQVVERGGNRFLRTYYHGERGGARGAGGGEGPRSGLTPRPKPTGAIDLRAVAVAVGVVGEEGKEGVEDEGAGGRGRR